MRIRAAVVGHVRSRAVLLALVLGAAATAGITPAQGESSRPVIVGDVVDRLAAAQLARDFRLPPREALARIERQPRVSALADTLRGQTRSYAGVWVDQVHGGIVNVDLTGAADDEAARASADHYGLGAVVHIIHVEHSMAVLESVMRAAQTELAPENSVAGAPFDLDIDVPRNVVQVNFADSAKLNATQSAWLFSAVATNLPLIRGHAEPSMLSACQWPTCDPPFRGGVWLSVAASGQGYGYCSSGFNAVQCHRWLLCHYSRALRSQYVV